MILTKNQSSVILLLLVLISLISEMTAFRDRLDQGGHLMSPRARKYLEMLRRKMAEKHGSSIASDPSEAGRSLPVNPDDDTELQPNREILHELFEGDIVLQSSQAKAIAEEAFAEADEEGDGKRKKRAVMSRTNGRRWSTTNIPYIFNGGSSSWQSAIRRGIQRWEETTCLTFRQGQASGTTTLNFIQGSGCYSNVGQVTRRSTQDVSIGRGCESVGIVAHEIAHALGFWHEQSRYDRDNYVRLDHRPVHHSALLCTYKINFGSIASGMEMNFRKRNAGESDDFGVQYDYGSVMHYGPTAFATSGRSIEALNSQFSFTMGQRTDVSFADIKQMNALYCSDRCSPLPCQNGGYTDPKNCGRCRCPPGFGGQYCSDGDSSTGCGGLRQASSQWQTIQGSSTCNFLLKGNGGRIELQITRISYSIRTYSCGDNFVEVKMGRDFATSGARFCGTQTRTVQSETDQMVVLARGRGSFTAQFRSLGGGSVVVSTPSPFTTQRPTWRPFTTRSTWRPFTTRPTWRPFTTTRRPITPRPLPGRIWSSWSEYSRCDQPCGGCGRQVKVRVCQTSSCRGRVERKFRRCNLQPCNGFRDAARIDQMGGQEEGDDSTDVMSDSTDVMSEPPTLDEESEEEEIYESKEKSSSSSKPSESSSSSRQSSSRRRRRNRREKRQTASGEQRVGEYCCRGYRLLYSRRGAVCYRR